MERREIEVGQSILFMDSQRIIKPALVTEVHGEPYYNESGELEWLPCINLITCSSNCAKSDDYGRQIERHSSVQHRSVNAYHEQTHGFPVGMTWQFIDEKF